jgi:hypothetical protein
MVHWRCHLSNSYYPSKGAADGHDAFAGRLPEAILSIISGVWVQRMFGPEKEAATPGTEALGGVWRAASSAGMA